MGIVAEFSPELVLASMRESRDGRRKKDECLPEKLKKGKTYKFLKDGQRHFWLDGECPLVERLEEDKSKIDVSKSTAFSWGYSRPKASIKILEAIHFMKDGKAWTRGKYKVVEVFNDDKVHFEGYWKIK
ncbi:MAG TPA: hypothetical protein VI968_00105 [archaeon]|nr:hypothetical protein [archaeon]